MIKSLTLKIKIDSLTFDHLIIFKIILTFDHLK